MLLKIWLGMFMFYLHWHFYSHFIDSGISNLILSKVHSLSCFFLSVYWPFPRTSLTMTNPGTKNSSRPTKTACSGAGSRPLDRNRSGLKNATVDSLVGNLSHSIIKAIEIKGKQFLVLCNPWGEASWEGPWSDGSKEWMKEWLEILPELRHLFGESGMECKWFCLFQQLEGMHWQSFTDSDFFNVPCLNSLQQHKTQGTAISFPTQWRSASTLNGNIVCNDSETLTAPTSIHGTDGFHQKLWREVAKERGSTVKKQQSGFWLAGGPTIKLMDSKQWQNARGSGGSWLIEDIEIGRGLWLVSGRYYKGVVCMCLHIIYFLSTCTNRHNMNSCLAPEGQR